MLVSRGLIKGCQDAAVHALVCISEKTSYYAKQDPRGGLIAADEAFINEMNANVVVGAER